MDTASRTNIDDLRVPNTPIPIPKMSGTNNAGPAGQEKINTDIITLTRWLTEEQSKHKEATGDFTYVSISAEEAQQTN